jgi:hypothetical protein
MLCGSNEMATNAVAFTCCKIRQVAGLTLSSLKSQQAQCWQLLCGNRDNRTELITNTAAKGRRQTPVGGFLGGKMASAQYISCSELRIRYRKKKTSFCISIAVTA